MPYIPLHHKYRPQTFTQLVGQDAIATTLSNALLQNRIAPAYLFTGARGTGKTSSARIFAKSLNCIATNGPTDQPCGVCETCRAIANGSALDVIEIDAASNTGVDNIRELIERAQFAPVQCRYKVYVVDECLTGDTLVQTSEGFSRIDDPTLEGKQVLSYNETTNAWEYKKVLRWLDQGDRQVYSIKTTQRTIRCTGNHLIRTDRGWIPARDVTAKTKILSPVPVAVGNLSTNTEQTDEYDASPEDINSSATNSVASPTTLMQSWQKPNRFDLTAFADVVNDWWSLLFLGNKGKDWSRFSPIGNGILTFKDMAYGSSEARTLWKRLATYLPSSWAWSTEPSWEMAASATLTHPANIQGWYGLTELHNTLGYRTSPIAFRNLDFSSLSWTTQDMETLRLAAQPVATPTFEKSLLWFAPIVDRKQSPLLGWTRSLQKGELGGISMMALSASHLKDRRRFNFTLKDFQNWRISCWLSGFVEWATQLKFATMFAPILANATTTFQWAQKQLGNGLQTINASPFQAWTTSLETVESVSLAGVETVYDIEVEDNHNFVANGLLVHNCHMLSAAAFNALLKTLEEPPDRVVFVLATTDPQRVLPTIISRCQRFDFRRIPLNAMVSHLKAIASKENIPITDEAVQLISQISQGGLRDAESQLDQLSLLIGEITADRVWDLVGAVPERDLMELMSAIAADQAESAIDTVRRLMDRGREPLIVLQNLASFYRDLLIAKTAPTRGDLVALTAPTWEQLCDFAKSFDVGTILQSQQHLKDSETQLKQSTQPRLWLEVTLLGLLPSAVRIQAAPSIAPKAISSKPAAKPVVADHTPTVAPNVAPDVVPSVVPEITPTIGEAIPRPSIEPIADPESSAAPKTDEQTLADLWQQIIANLKPPGTQALLRQQGHLLSFDGQHAQVGIASENLLRMAQSKLENIKAAFLKTLGTEVTLSLSVAAPSKAAAIPATQAPESIAPAAIENPKPTPSPSAFTEPSPQASPEISLEVSPQPIAKPSSEVLPIASIEPVIQRKESISSPIATASEKPAIYQSSWEDDEITRAAINLASAFNGAVVDLEDDLVDAPELTIEEQVTSLNAEAIDDPEAEEPDEDVDF